MSRINLTSSFTAVLVAVALGMSASAPGVAYADGPGPTSCSVRDGNIDAEQMQAITEAARDETAAIACVTELVASSSSDNADPVICAILIILGPDGDIEGVIIIDSEGNVWLLDEGFFDCPPYGDVFGFPPNDDN